MTKISYNSYIIEKEETIMNKNDILAEMDDNEILVETMLGGLSVKDNIDFNHGYLKSFVASAMREIPEFKRRVEKRIARHEFLASDANK